MVFARDRRVPLLPVSGDFASLYSLSGLVFDDPLPPSPSASKNFRLNACDPRKFRAPVLLLHVFFLLFPLVYDFDDFIYKQAALTLFQVRPQLPSLSQRTVFSALCVLFFFRLFVFVPPLDVATPLFSSPFCCIPWCLDDFPQIPPNLPPYLFDLSAQPTPPFALPGPRPSGVWFQRSPATVSLTFLWPLFDRRILYPPVFRMVPLPPHLVPHDFPVLGKFFGVGLSRLETFWKV